MITIKISSSLLIPILHPKNSGDIAIKSLRKDHVGVPALISNGKTLTDSLEKAEVLNNQFYSVFTDEDLVNTPQIDQLEYPTMPEISFNTPGIHELLLDLDTNKSPVQT